MSQRQFPASYGCSTQSLLFRMFSVLRERCSAAAAAADACGDDVEYSARNTDRLRLTSTGKTADYRDFRAAHATRRSVC
jgi:hypothetical protein